MPDEDESDRERLLREEFSRQEEEAWYAQEEERIKLEQLKKEAEEEEEKEQALEEMAEWFRDNFEDPQIDTPRDAEDQTFVFIWGGPFEAADVLYAQFADAYPEAWISEAAMELESGGTTEWAPTSHGDFYDHPEPEPDEDKLDEGSEIRLDGGPVEAVQAISSDILARLDDLEAQLAELRAEPAPIGHNHPPDDVGVPPYDDGTIGELEAVASVTRAELTSNAPNRVTLEAAKNSFKKYAEIVLRWVGRKLDLAVDESIKAGISVAKWKSLGLIAASVAGLIAELLKHL